MEPVNKVTPQGRSARPTHKTKEDFLRWLHEQDRSKRPVVVEEPGVPADHPTSRALMDWADDGGAT